MQVLTDPAECGPVTLALCQDVQTQAWDFPEALFAPQVWTPRRPPPDAGELQAAAAVLRGAARPLAICGGGVLYAEAEAALQRFCEAHGIPLAETQAGKSAVPAGHWQNLGSIGVTGTAAANALAAEADVVLAVGTRLADFTTGSRALFRGAGRRIIGLNVQPFDAAKHGAQPLVADAGAGLAALSAALAGWRSPEPWTERAALQRMAWLDAAAAYTAAGNDALPSDAQVIGVVQRQARPTDIVVCAAGGLPGELHKHWQAALPGGYHMEYGFSTMGYEIAGGLGVKLAQPRRDVFVLVGDGSYLMLNSEIATSVALGLKLTIVLLDNRGFGCINRLQRATGGAGFNNLLEQAPSIDFAAHAASLGAIAEKVGGLGELAGALDRAREALRTSVIVIDTDATATTEAGGAWWDVAVPEVSDRPEVREARARYEAAVQYRSMP
jgi:3D-(3,5/4)-trihydroxycyclohexane-1,2-dione acylhydrolase (decyclizing)